MDRPQTPEEILKKYPQAEAPPQPSEEWKPCVHGSRKAEDREIIHRAAKALEESDGVYIVQTSESSERHICLNDAILAVLSVMWE